MDKLLKKIDREIPKGAKKAHKDMRKAIKEDIPHDRLIEKAKKVLKKKSK